MSLSGAEFARTWFAEWVPDPPVFGPATQQLVDLVEHEPEKAWTFILLLIHEAPNDDGLNWIGAGPLEDLMCDHGALFIDRAEEAARRDERFRKCLGWVCLG